MSKAEDLGLSKPMQLILSAVSVSYIVLAVSFQYYEVQKRFKPVNSYLTFLGLSQSWGFFAPTPKFSMSIFGIVTMSDGSKLLWEPPNPTMHSAGSKASFNRYVKWESQRITDPKNSRFLTQLSNHVCNQLKSKEIKPVSCSFFRETSYCDDHRQGINSREKLSQNREIRSIGYETFQ